jgi:hypothetical protein
MRKLRQEKKNQEKLAKQPMSSRKEREELETLKAQNQ